MAEFVENKVGGGRMPSVVEKAENGRSVTNYGKVDEHDEEGKG